MVAMVTQLSPQPLFGLAMGNPFLFTGRRYTAEDCIGNPALFMPGDFNGDGRVDQSDLDLVLTNLGRTDVPAGWLAVDQLVGMIDQSEMDLVLLNWGRSLMSLRLLVVIAGYSVWQWMSILGAAIGAVSVAELLASHTRLFGRFSGAVAIVAGALASTIVGHSLFPPLAISSPHPIVFAIAGAIVSAVCWTLVCLFRAKTRGIKTSHPGTCATLIMCGVVAGGILGLLTSTFVGALYCVVLGLVGGLFLAASRWSASVHSRASGNNKTLLRPLDAQVREPGPPARGIGKPPTL